MRKETVNSKSNISIYVGGSYRCRKEASPLFPLDEPHNCFIVYLLLFCLDMCVDDFIVVSC